MTGVGACHCCCRPPPLAVVSGRVGVLLRATKPEGYVRSTRKTACSRGTSFWSKFFSLSLSRVFIQTAQVLRLYITQAGGISSRLLQLAAINMHIYSVKIRSYVLCSLNSCLNAILLYEHGDCGKTAFEFAPCWRAHQCRETCVLPLSAPTE